MQQFPTISYAYFSNEQGEFISLAQVTTTQQLKFWLDGKRKQQFLQIVPFQDDQGLDWLIVVVVPEWATFEPHLIGIDMQMPVVYGYEATTQVQATAAIALTASVLEEERAIILSADCDDFLRKPFRQGDIFATMNKHIWVRYIYDDQSPAKQEKSDTSFTLNPALRQAAITSTSVQKLLGKWVANLKQAIVRVGLDFINTFIEQIRIQDAALTNALTHYIDNFEYEKISTLIQDNRELHN
jgi:CheY-like chemotaxis protein